MIKRECELSIIVRVDTEDDGYVYKDLVKWCATIEPLKVGKSTISIVQFYDTHDWENI